jgi:hypothetical protein
MGFRLVSDTRKRTQFLCCSRYEPQAQEFGYDLMLRGLFPSIILGTTRYNSEEKRTPSLPVSDARETA